MRSLRVITASLLAVLMSGFLVLLAAPASAQASSPCPPGQPGGRPPGAPPNQATPPDGRPPDYPPGRCNLQLSRGSAARGESVTASGTGFAPGESVVLSLGGQRVATLTADPTGAIRGEFTVPDEAPLGRTAVEARGAQTVLTAGFEVVAAPAAARSRAAATAPSSVARTGAYIAAIAAVGAALVALGAVMVGAARRRRGMATA